MVVVVVVEREVTDKMPRQTPSLIKKVSCHIETSLAFGIKKKKPRFC
jgi:hypothetical protein